ncbi:MAG: class I SAM-dependent methyltransferase [Polyangiaceae bacterium]
MSDQSARWGALVPPDPPAGRAAPRWLLHEDEAVLVVDKPAFVSIRRDEGPEVTSLLPRVERWLEARGDRRGVEAIDPLPLHASGLVILTRGRQRRPLRARYRWWLTREGRERRERVERKEPPKGREAHAPHIHRWRVDLDGAGRRLRVEAPLPEAMRRWLEGEDDALPDDLDAALARALARREALAALPDTDAYRLVHGAGDDLPGVELDRYRDHAVLALRSEEAVAREAALLDAVLRLGPAGVYLKRRPRQANVVVDTRNDELAPKAPARGEAAPSPLVVHERGTPLVTRLDDGLSTGVFLDQRDARAWLAGEAAGKRLLNLFCYHGAFTVAAVVGGVAESVSVDASGAALERARENLDAVSADPEHHRLVRADALRYVERGREPYDLIVLDPPSFATTKKSTFRAARDYPALAAAALGRLAPGGWMLACTNHRGIVASKFRRQLEAALERTGIAVAELYELEAPIDFPAPPGRDPHLKRIIVRRAP